MSELRLFRNQPEVVTAQLDELQFRALKEAAADEVDRQLRDYEINSLDDADDFLLEVANGIPSKKQLDIPEAMLGTVQRCLRAFAESSTQDANMLADKEHRKVQKGPTASFRLALGKVARELAEGFHTQLSQEFAMNMEAWFELKPEPVFQLRFSDTPEETQRQGDYLSFEFPKPDPKSKLEIAEQLEFPSAEVLEEAASSASTPEPQESSATKDAPALSKAIELHKPKRPPQQNPPL